MSDALHDSAQVGVLADHARDRLARMGKTSVPAKATH
jgi:hypothetical protein